MIFFNASYKGRKADLSAGKVAEMPYRKTL